MKAKFLFSPEIVRPSDYKAVEVVESKTLCPSCEGSGRSLPWIEKEKLPCHTCEGQGTVTLQEFYQYIDYIRDMDGGPSDITNF